MRSGGILALDLATVTGWAYGLPGDARPACGAWKMPPHAQRPCAFFGAFENEIADFLSTFGPRRVVFEAPINFMSPGKDGRVATSVDAAMTKLGLRGVLFGTCHHYDLEPQPIPASTARANVIGSARFKGDPKPIITAWVRERGIAVPTHDAADAAVLWLYATGVRAPGRK